jgi:putative SOS response-associated peptidase YedK
MINARCETLDQKASFKQLLARNRCLIPADGFLRGGESKEAKIAMRVRKRSCHCAYFKCCRMTGSLLFHVELSESDWA